ncbi:hypothetical protein BD769DRAFT_876389 [Suillus cothurnatus]|nr:hypothetical protein BD769DRAFT_876389 [Suillus cothurnatus]
MKFQVYERYSVGENNFFVRFVLRMFQERLCITRKLEVEFVARGRIWVLRFYMGQNGMWQVGYGLSEPSSPVHPKAELAIWARGKPPDSSCATQKPLIINMKRPWDSLIPEELFFSYGIIGPCKNITAVSCQLDDWPMDDNNDYVNCDGTLRVGLTMVIQ